MFPRPVGRMACAADPLTASATVFSIADGWEPPAPMDGYRTGRSCVTAATSRSAALAPTFCCPSPARPGGRRRRSSCASGSRRLRRGARITATARRLAGPRVMPLMVDSLPIPETRPPTSSHYLWLRPVRFPNEGCWLVSVAVDGVGVGAAIVPVTDRPAEPAQSERGRQLPVVTACPARSKREPGFQLTSHDAMEGGEHVVLQRPHRLLLVDVGGRARAGERAMNGSRTISSGTLQSPALACRTAWSTSSTTSPSSVAPGGDTPSSSARWEWRPSTLHSCKGKASTSVGLRSPMWSKLSRSISASPQSVSSTSHSRRPRAAATVSSMADASRPLNGSISRSARSPPPAGPARHGRGT